MIKLPRPTKKTSNPEPPPEPAGNLASVLVLFARWRRCCVCRAPVLFVNGQCGTDGDVECPTCTGIREELARKLRPVQPANLHLAPSLPARVALRLRALWSTANDNATVRPC